MKHLCSSAFIRTPSVLQSPGMSGPSIIHTLHPLWEGAPSAPPWLCSYSRTVILTVDIFSPTYCWPARNNVSVQPCNTRSLQVTPAGGGPHSSLTFHPSTDPSLSPNTDTGLNLNTLFQALLQVTFKSCLALCCPEWEKVLSKSQFCTGSSLRGHLEWAPWKPNKGAGQLLSVSELRGRVGTMWSAGGYLGNTSVEFLNLRALLFLSNYILMLLLSWKLEQSLTTT